MPDIKGDLAARLLWEAFDYPLLDPLACFDPLQVTQVNDFQFVDCEGQDSGAGITSLLILSEKFENL